MMTHIEIPGQPQGKGRPRFTKSGHAYTPEKTRQYEKAVRECYEEQGYGLHFSGPVALEILAVFRIPKSRSKKDQERMLFGEIKPTTKPDADNIGKAIADALNGIAYDDDKQITSLLVRKQYGTHPGTFVTIQDA